MTETDRNALLSRITRDPDKLCGKPIIRGHRLAVEHVLGMLAAGDTPETILDGYAWLELEDIQACLLFAAERVGDLDPAGARRSNRERAGVEHSL